MMDNTCVRVALVGEMVVAPVAWFHCQLLGPFGGRGVAQSTRLSVGAFPGCASLRAMVPSCTGSCICVEFVCFSNPISLPAVGVLFWGGSR